MPVPVSQIWEDSVAFARREGHLLVPLALATLAIGQAMLELAVAASDNKLSPFVFGGLGLMGVFLAIIGQMAIQALVLHSGLSVREGLHLALNRLPKFIVLTLLLALLVVVMVTPLAVGLAAVGFDPASKAQDLPPFATVYMLAMIGFLGWISVRLYVLTPLIVDQNPPVGDAVRQSFALTRGHSLIILGVFLVFLLVGTIIQAAAQGVVGFIFAAIGKMAGLAYLDIVMVALAVGMAAAAVGLLTSVFAALLYRHLNR